MKIFCKVFDEAVNLVPRLHACQNEDDTRGNVTHFTPKCMVCMMCVLIHREEAGSCSLHTKDDRTQDTAHPQHVFRKPEGGEGGENQSCDLDVRVAQMPDRLVRCGGHEDTPQHSPASENDK